MSSLFSHSRNKLSSVGRFGVDAKSPDGQEDLSASVSDPRAIAKAKAISAADSRKGSFSAYWGSKARAASFASDRSSITNSSAHQGTTKDTRASEASVDSHSNRRKSRTLLGGFLPRSASKASLVEPSFEVLRVREGSSEPLHLTRSGRETSPFQVVDSSPDADESLTGGNVDAYRVVPPVLSPTSAAEAYEFGYRREDDVQGGQAYSVAGHSHHPTSHVRTRSPFTALTRRFSGLGDGTLLRSITPTSPISPIEQPAGRRGTFNLHSMRHLSHGGAATTPEDADQVEGHRYGAAQGFPFDTPAAGSIVDSPGQEFEGVATPPEWPIPSTSGSPVLGGSTTAASRLYSAPSHQSSSISVAKFKTGRIRSESGTFTFDAGGSTSRPMSPVGYAAVSPTESLKPSEQLAALEAEMARGSRATPLLKHLEDRYENHALRSHLRYSSSPGQSTGYDPPALPQKDERPVPNAWRSSWTESFTPDSRPFSSSRPSSPLAIASHSDRSQQRMATPSASGSAGRSTPQATATRGRGWDSATVLAHFARGGNSGSPRTLLEALSQIEGGDDEFSRPPQRRWLDHHADPVSSDRTAHHSNDGAKGRTWNPPGKTRDEAQQDTLTPPGLQGTHPAPGDNPSPLNEGPSTHAADVLLAMAATPEHRSHNSAEDGDGTRQGYFDAQVQSPKEHVRRPLDHRPELSVQTKDMQPSGHELPVNAGHAPITNTTCASDEAKRKRDRSLPATPLHITAKEEAWTKPIGVGEQSPPKGREQSPSGSKSRVSRPPRRAKSQCHPESPRRGAGEGADRKGPAASSGRNVRPHRAATLPTKPGPQNLYNFPRLPQKSEELVSFHAQQAGAIAEAQASAGIPVSMAETTMPHMMPAALDPTFAPVLPHHERNAIELRHREALNIAAKAYQDAYEAHMRPALASLPAKFRGVRRHGGTLLPSAPHLPSGMWDDRSPNASVKRRPSAKFMDPPPVEATSQALPAIDSAPVAVQCGSQKLTDDLKRANETLGAEAGAYSATKRNLE